MKNGSAEELLRAIEPWQAGKFMSLVNMEFA
jgi:hypothetical protein